MTHLSIAPEITLRHGSLAATLAPAAGGRITRLVSAGAEGPIDWLVPLSDDVRQAGFESTAWPKAGCYPLVPFSNRIRHGQFAWAGREARLPIHPGETHALHGGTQQAAWTLARQDTHSAVMAYAHERGQQGWPWAFSVEQTVALDPQGLSLTLKVTNTDTVEMPCGMGFHPYFPARFAHRIGFEAQNVWTPDAEFLGTPPRPIPTTDDYTVPRALVDAELTQYYGGWDGQARLQAADGTTIRLQADDAMRHLVLHRPAGRGYFCVEPVTHVSNATVLSMTHLDTGWLVLAPGASTTCRMALRLPA
ncbi:aldose epimerase [Rhodoferax koreense]|uniref:Aldose epimerase n=1 Tax=Rhodoferax koreensis TaxID=1842727 RepID=A0A1P8JQQ9_9BURK|nr:aldose 1-epimerase [Rhodoferax koreense]APW36096.1 aldose epimerase [Rhodoferax koreense]